MTPIFKRLTAMLAVLFVLGCSASAEEPPLKGARLGGPFTLVAQDGRTVRDSDFAGRYRLVYFGYSFCPDVCPTDLLTIGQALSQFEKTAPARGARVQPIFITIDPERDTPTVLKPYVSSFHPRLIGLTGPPLEVAQVAKAYGVYGARQKGATGKDYLMDHSRQAMLFGPKGEPIALLPQDEGAKAVAAALDRWVT